nr:glycosyltransferase [Xenophilus azovorans]
MTAIGCDVKTLFIDASEPDFQTILENHLRCAALDVSAFDVVISTKAPTYAIKHPAHVMNLIHTVRVFDDMFDEQWPTPSPTDLNHRARLHAIEFDAIQSAKARFANGAETARRLYRWRGLEADVLHPPLVVNRFRTGPYGDYFFLPGRLHRWKRVDLAIKAVLASTMPLKLKIAGEGEAEQALMALAGGDERIEFLGRIDDEELIELYAGALAVPFTPLREDFGYITIEAFASGKPVITCTDSGEPARIVRNRENGFLCLPNPQAIKEAMESLYVDRDLARLLGENGMRLPKSMSSWEAVARQLIEAALAPSPRTYDRRTNVCVLDMQPIDPPVGGGRLRLLGLYHDLGSEIDCTYVGTYDWPGEPYRSHQLSPTLREVDIPLTAAHHAAADDMKSKSGDKVVIDLAFSQQAHLSPDYVNTARQAAVNADVVFFSHPWIYPLVKDVLRPDQVLIYDSHNVEGYLRAQLLNCGNAVERNLLRGVIEDENECGWGAQWILACSHEDLLRFNRLYGFPLENMRVVPNGVMAFRDLPATPEEKLRARADLGVAENAKVTIFIGSAYGPNVEAAEFIADVLAPAMPHVVFVIAGGVGTAIQRSNTPNLRVTGQLSEAEKITWLKAADLGINPMLSGSGTNIKMFDFMALGLPVVSTPIGARGIETAGRAAMVQVPAVLKTFSRAIANLVNDKALYEQMSKNARACVEEGYSWERISSQLGCFVESRRKIAGQARPLYSVVIPSYERHSQLDALMHCLSRQIERDFEVVIVDQSAQRWSGASGTHGFPLTYFHTPVKGAVRARNTGAMLAQGRILAFVDDDCQPVPEWLVESRKYFVDSEVVGVEGMVYSDHLDDQDWRPVSNVNCEGIGFLTANLMVRSAAFQYLGGFDLQFDRPHFREDTDFGWRLTEVGKVPYAHDVRVFHPAQPRALERESAVERAKFFQKDALLYKKHPDNYEKLFYIEQHFRGTPGFKEHLIEGFKVNDIEVPKFIVDALGARA